MGISNSTTYLGERLAALRKTQNADGGWPYYSGKVSWLEPTAYAALALDGQPEADKAWELIKGWQSASGGWRPAADVPGSNWTTALAIFLASRKRGEEARVSKGLEWLGNHKSDGAWPWRRGGDGAVEPTALAMLALRGAGQAVSDESRNFLWADKLQPETCGVALVGLQGAGKGLAPMAEKWAAEAGPGFTRAWIHLGLRVNGVDVPEPEAGAVPKNLALVALEALGASGGNHRLFVTEAGR